ncbi:MAG: helix-turn-helix transcriptional regulator [Burkholderiales bacterium]|nr:helix-turn-helix transcriptional regulator [Burkholderiales bacterium]
MSQQVAISPLELGRYLNQARERAGMKQAELARKITWSPAVLSRVESGDRALAPDELQTILAAIDTPEASRLGEVLRREWKMLPRPPLDHPDQDLIWEAERVAAELVELRDRPDVRHAFERRLSEYIDEIKHTAALLMKRNHQIAFIGSIGIGKSTAICRMTGLEVPSSDSARPIPVLEAGAGGITICEVHLRTGPGHGLLIEPRSDDDIRADVTDFAEYVLGAGSAVTQADSTEDADTQGISKETERAIRNLSRLRIRREKSKDGKQLRRDEARELATAHPTVRELVVEILARMELHRRDRRDVWYEPSTGKEPLNWLKDTFEAVNNGRHPDFTLPRRIEVVVPKPLIDAGDLSVRLIDTKGIDRTAARADLEGLLDESHTVAILCSGFNNAPAAEARLLLERARDTGVRGLEIQAAILALPRPSEALAVKDESGVRVDSAEEGYSLKEEQVAMSLQPLKLGVFAIGFFNAYQDDPQRLRSFLQDRLERVRETFRKRMKEVSSNARALLQNHEREQVQEVVRHAASALRTWASRNAKPQALSAHVQDSLMEQIGRAAATTVRACVRREGEWHNLSYTHHLGYGARRMAALSLGNLVASFSELCGTLGADPQYLEAKDLIAQADRVLVAAYDELLRKVQLMGQTAFRDELELDARYWAACNDEWGRGPGYKQRIAGHSEAWFRNDPRLELERELLGMIEREWGQAVARMLGLLEGGEQ